MHQRDKDRALAEAWDVIAQFAGKFLAFCPCLSCSAASDALTVYAVGTESGEVVVWDFETRVVARTFKAHGQPVTCVTWARNGRYVMSGSLDRTVVLWDILDNKQARPCHFAQLQLPI